MANLPSRETCRRYTTTALALLFLLAACLLFKVNFGRHRDLLGTTLLIVALLGVSLGLYRQQRIVLRLASTVFLLVAVVLPVGVFNPFAKGDKLANGKVVAAVAVTPQTLAWVVLLAGVLLALAWFVNPVQSRRVKGGDGS